MLVSWEKRAGLHGEHEGKDGKDVFKGLLGDFWEGLALMFVRHVDNEEADSQTLEGVATLLQVGLFLEIFFFRNAFHKTKQQVNMAVRVILY